MQSGDAGEIMPDEKMKRIVGMIKDRCTYLNDLWENSYYFFETPSEVDLGSIRPKWSNEKRSFFSRLIATFENTIDWKAQPLEEQCKNLAAENNLKPGDVLLPLRIMLVGKKIGPGVFDIAEIIGKEETVKRISLVLDRL
jgi:glutamyl-tRNA synthetase